MTIKQTTDQHDPATIRMTVEPSGCQECDRRSKCKLRLDGKAHKCAVARGKRE